jgi:hypothetical protein
MNGLELLKEHPKTSIVVKQWYLDKLLESMKDDNLPEDFKKYAREAGIDDERIGAMIDSAPRGLFDVFDSHKVYVDISCLNDKFLWGINNDMNNAVYNTRLEADEAAIVEAFKLLEAKI